MAYVVPFLFAANPALLMHGEALDILTGLATAAFGVWLICGGIFGYLLRIVNAPERTMMIVVGAAILWPTTAPYGIGLVNLAGGVFALSYFIFLRVRAQTA